MKTWWGSPFWSLKSAQVLQPSSLAELAFLV